MAMVEMNEDTGLDIYDQRDILSNLSSEIQLDTIRQQIEKLFDEDDTPKNSSDVFESFVQQFKFLSEKYKDNETFISDLETAMEEITTGILTLIESKFDFTITFMDSLPMADRLHYIHMIYNFFINNVEDNIESLFYNYFIQHINEFPEKEINVKDQTFINFKGILPNDVLNQIYYYTDNIETLKTYNMYSEDLLELMIENDPMKECNFWITKIFIDNLYTDISFGRKFKDIIVNIAFNSNKLYKVQNLIIKKYSNK